MSSASDPYQPPKPVEPKPTGVETGKIRYLYAYSYVFENPNWMTNIMYGFVCAIIPVIGPLLLLGYQFEVAESLHRNPGKTYPDFDFNKFSYYLTRGIWPFVVNIICSLPIGLLVGCFYAVMAISALGAGAAGGKDFGVVLILIIMPIEMLVMTIISIILGLFILPLFLRSGLSQDLGQTFKMGWVMDFVKKNWKEALLFQLFFMVTAAPMAMLGMMLCIFPLYAVVALISMAQAHMFYQLYSLHLSRGGEPIPLKDPPPQPA